MTRGMGMPAIIALIAVMLVGGGVLYVLTMPQGERMIAQGEQMMSEGEKMMQEGEEMMQEGTHMMDEGEKMMDENAAVMDANDAPLAAGSYEMYAPEKLAKAENGDVVLFFHASWCPSCRALNSDIESNRGDIPDGVMILQVDYDSNTALRQKYGVTRQHTMVQVASDGTEIAQWSGSRTLSGLLGEIQ